VLAVLLLDAGLALVTIAVLSRFSSVTRGHDALVAVIGLLFVVVALALPARAIRLEGPPLALERLMPEYEFGESHEIRVQASAARVYRAIREVTASEIRFFRLLTWIRAPRLPGQGKESILNPGATRPILDIALGSGFFLVHEEPGRELVVGTLVCCSGAARPTTGAELLAMRDGDLAKAFMNFAVIDAGGGTTRVVTQTRIHATRCAAALRFATYWRLIYPGSAFIRRMWLRAIRDRAEASG
jgi:hypothetical protein